MDIKNYREWIEELSQRANLELSEMNDGLNLLTMEITNGHGSISTLLEESRKVCEDTIKSDPKRASRKGKRNKRDVDTDSPGRRQQHKLYEDEGLV